MNRNSSSHFSATDNKINIGRSKFNRDSWTKTSMNVGDLVPFYVDEVLPGDTFDMKTSVVARMATLTAPVMDNCYLDTYFFFCPARLTWEHWKEFHGENNVNAWVNEQEYRVPSFTYNAEISGVDYAIRQFSVGDYMGLPIETNRFYGYTDGTEVQVLPLRAYHLIWNEWFRDQNLQAPVLINTGDVVDGEEALELMKLRKANKFHDYFTSALPEPQKGSAVMIPGLDNLPVLTASQSLVTSGEPLLMRAVEGGSLNGDLSVNGNRLVMSNDGTGLESFDKRLYPSNLFVDSNGATIDALRTAFQIQKLLWRDGNGGTRYTEILRSHFGVVSPDARLQRPEYLGGKRIALTMNQVIQQSATDPESQQTPLGNVGGISKTVDSFDGFTKSFTEHGYLIGVCCVRADHTYQQGYNRLWSRFNRFDFYYPELANIGEQAIKNKEIFAVGNEEKDNEVFGYQEAWAEYRYRPSYVTGAMRSFHDESMASLPSLGQWNYADVYASQPFLSASWIEEPTEFVNRTLAVQGTDIDHEMVFADFYFDLKCTRPMPVYSVPGLVDHF